MASVLERAPAAHSLPIPFGALPAVGRRPLRYERSSRSSHSRKTKTAAKYGQPGSTRSVCKARGALKDCRGFFGTPGHLHARQSVLLSAERQGHVLVLSATLVESEVVADEELAQHKDLVVGHLDNGLRYVILPNAVPPKRFDAHLEIHAGSVDELPHQQGIAHLVEHVTFLGSQRREGLLGTGARSNAYTDFHHTVFHVHAPLVNQALAGSRLMLPQVLEALTEIAFRPEFLVGRIEKEQQAVLAEAQMMNTIEYRVDCQLLQFLHAENALGCRFPIGKTEQVLTWDQKALVAFWEKWYFPANATLYLVGDFGAPVPEVRDQIAAAFGHVPVSPSFSQPPPAGGYSPIPQPGASATLPPAAPAPGHSNGASGNGHARFGMASNGQPAQPRERHALRPPVAHRWGCGDAPLPAGPPVSMFRHRLLQHFMLSIFCKLPVRPIRAASDMRVAFMTRVLLSVLHFRMNGRYVAANPPFVAIDLDYSDSGREGCAVSTLTITSEPGDWRGAVQVAIEEVRRLQRYGVTGGELERYRAALLRDSEQAAEQAGSVPSADTLDFVMEALALGHTVMDQRMTHEMLAKWASSITVEEVNSVAASLLAFASHVGNPEDALREAYERPDAYLHPPGPTHATAIVACLPVFTDPSGNSRGGAAPMARGASLTTDKHVDPAAAASVLREDDSNVEEVPEGLVRFELDAEEIHSALAAPSLEVEPPQDIDVPSNLLDEAAVEALVAERNPHYVPLARSSAGASAHPPPDPTSGVVQRRLSNGIRLNYWRTTNEPRAALVRLVFPGGRAMESWEPGPAGVGAVSIGTRTLSESGTVGHWRREQVELFCISKLINCMLDSDEEFVYMDCHFAVGDKGLQAVLELVHLFLEAPRWEQSAAERAKQMFLSHYKALDKNLERATADRFMAALLGPDRRFRDARPEDIEALTLEGMRGAVMSQLRAGNLEVSVVGDFEADELEALALRYLGTVAPRHLPAPALPKPVTLLQPPPHLRHQRWHLKDSDERAVAYIAGGAPCRWGSFGGGEAARVAPTTVEPPFVPGRDAGPAEVARARDIRKAHPLYADVTLRLLTEILNSRLFTTVRDALGLTYDVSFELSVFDRLRAGWFFVHVTSTPEKIGEARDASLRVLRGLRLQRITERELLRARRIVLTKHESELKDNMYRLGLLTHLQCDEVPLKVLECLRDFRIMYESATAEDVYDAYQQLALDDERIVTCIGTSGPTPPAEGDKGGGGVQAARIVDDGKVASPNLLLAVAAAMQDNKLAAAMSELATRTGLDKRSQQQQAGQ